MQRKNSLDDIRTQIRSLESVFFNSKKPINVEKLNVDSMKYDSNYEARIRKSEYSSLHLLNEIYFFKIEEPSQAYYILSKLEEELLSPDFYRGFIFDDALSDVVADLDKAHKKLDEELRYIKDELTNAEYKRVYKMICPQYCPSTKKGFFGEIERLIRKINRESKRLN